MLPMDATSGSRRPLSQTPRRRSGAIHDLGLVVVMRCPFCAASFHACGSVAAVHGTASSGRSYETLMPIGSCPSGGEPRTEVSERQVRVSAGRRRGGPRAVQTDCHVRDSLDDRLPPGPRHVRRQRLQRATDCVRVVQHPAVLQLHGKDERPVLRRCGQKHSE